MVGVTGLDGLCPPAFGRPLSQARVEPQAGSHPDMESGRGDWIRTSDFFVPNEALYQAEPHPDSREREKMSNSTILCKR